MAEQIEGIKGFPGLLADLFGQRLKEDAAISQFIDDDLLALSAIPPSQEVIEGSIVLGECLAGVLLERLCDELAVGVEVLNALGY